MLKKLNSLSLPLRTNLSHVQDVSLIIGNSTVTPSTNIRNLGVMFDPVMSMSSQVNSICSSTNYHLRNIARIRKNIDHDTFHHVVRCLVTSRLDYCNSLLYGITKAHLKRLPLVFNTELPNLLSLLTVG